ncbi:hypothetical protein [Solimonas variicoloris]|uniref:hypothetical protein n=1 Tax=Solimonas variicoloris TaxID=254408 RepID=UPI00344CB05C
MSRGDLAVECGSERLAEVQEPLLWICESARVAVIRASQALAALDREGVPPRTANADAAMADRAECVMLNNGTPVVAAFRALDDVLRQPQAAAAEEQRRASRPRPSPFPPTEPSCRRPRRHGGGGRGALLRSPKPCPLPSVSPMPRRSTPNSTSWSFPRSRTAA